MKENINQVRIIRRYKMTIEYKITGNTEETKTYKVIDPDGEEYGFFKSIDEAQGFIRGLLEGDRDYYQKYYTKSDFRIEEAK
jgi:hypothetical protein